MTWSWMMLGVQALMAVATVLTMSRRVLPGVHRFSQPALVLDVWGPLILALPMLAFVRGMDHSVAREGWVIIGGPMSLGTMAVGMAMIRSARIGSPLNANWSMANRLRLAGFVTGVGALVMLLGAAHDLTVWMGQVAFAIAALMLWVNTPDHVPQSDSIDVEVDGRIGGGLALAMLCSLMQAAAIWTAGPEHRVASMVMAMVAGAFVLAGAARLAGPVACIRLGGWSLAFGVLFGLGTISLTHLVPHALRAIYDSQTSPSLRVAYGFGSLAVDVTWVLIGGAMIVAGDRIPRQWRLATGLLILVMATLGIVRHLPFLPPTTTTARP